MSSSGIAKTNVIRLSTGRIRVLNLKLRNLSTCTQERGFLLQEIGELRTWNTNLVTLNKELINKKESWWVRNKGTIGFIGGVLAAAAAVWLAGQVGK